MPQFARWNLTVSQSTDADLRKVLASQGRGRTNLSRFVEEAVRARIFELTAAQIKADNARVPAETIESAVEEALEWARRA